VLYFGINKSHTYRWIHSKHDSRASYEHITKKYLLNNITLNDTTSVAKHTKWFLILCNGINISWANAVRRIWTSHSGYEESYQQKLAWSRKQAVLLASCLLLVSWFSYSVTLTMEVTSSSETLADFQQITWYYIPDGSTRWNMVCLNYALIGARFK
jgi:hypothetical protein